MPLTIRVKNPFRQTLTVAVAVISLFAIVAVLTKSPAKRDSGASGQFQDGAWQVYFSPHGGCTDAIVKQLDQAKTSIYVHAYSFTSEPIAKSLVDAHKRSVKISVILDKSQRTENYSEADFLSHAGINVLIDDRHAMTITRYW